jgi:hypothetical protein
VPVIAIARERAPAGQCIADCTSQFRLLRQLSQGC